MRKTGSGRGRVLQSSTSSSWRLGSDFYLRTAWTSPATASFSLDLFVNKQLRPQYWLVGCESSAAVLANARRILGLAREPAAEAVVGFQITDLPLVGHGIFQDADQAHSDRWPRVILGFIELSCEFVGGY